MNDSTTGEMRPQPSFLGSVNVVLVTYAVDGLLALATGAVIARAIGADGRGAYGIFILSVAFGQMLLGLGTGNAAIYYLGRGELGLRQVLSAAHAVALAALPVSALAALAVWLTPWSEKVMGDGVGAWLFAIAVPVLLHLNLMRLVLQGLHRFVDLGVATVGQQALLLGAVTAMYVSDTATTARIIGALVAATAAAGAFALVRIGLAQVDLAQVVRPRLDVIRRMATFGLQGEAGNILQLANYRIDQYVVFAYVSLAGVGVYAVASSLTEAVFILANAVALVLLPRLTALDPAEAARAAPLASRNTMLVAAAGAVALGALAPWGVPLIFGEAFRDSVEALWLLLPGAVALAGSKVLTSYIFSQGRPLLNTGITAVALAVTLAADFAFVPWLGVNGAALASSIAYSAHFGAALFVYQRLSGHPAHHALIPRPSDARIYAGAVRNVLARARAERAAPSASG